MPAMTSACDFRKVRHDVRRCGHADDQSADRLHDSRSTDAIGRVGPLGCDKLSVPAENGVGCDDGCDAAEDPTPKDLALRGESAPLIVCESKSLSAELLLEYAVFFNEVVDGLGLVAVHPASEGGEEELKREEFGHCILIIDSQGD